MLLNANLAYPTSIKFGAGRINEIAEACRAVGMKNPLFVTDRGFHYRYCPQNLGFA